MARSRQATVWLLVLLLGASAPCTAMAADGDDAAAIEGFIHGMHAGLGELAEAAGGLTEEQ
jgi:hypothetical protein